MRRRRRWRFQRPVRRRRGSCLRPPPPSWPPHSHRHALRGVLLRVVDIVVLAAVVPASSLGHPHPGRVARNRSSACSLWPAGHQGRRFVGVRLGHGRREFGHDILPQDGRSCRKVRALRARGPAAFAEHLVSSCAPRSPAPSLPRRSAWRSPLIRPPSRRPRSPSLVFPARDMSRLRSSRAPPPPPSQSQQPCCNKRGKGLH